MPIKTVDITTGEVSCQYPIPVKEWDVQKIVEALEENGYKVAICGSPIITVDPRVNPPLVTYHHTKNSIHENISTACECVKSI
ncbi:MAG TPA: hypothetical protein ENI45_03740 [Thermoplasmatales archaeon]|nr:hypothetical protein [Thermoplasmatales archaeon]